MGGGEALQRLLDEETSGRSIWVSFDWAKHIDLETALLERVADDWPPPMQRRAQALHSGTIWLSEAGLALSRVTPLPST